MAYVFIRKCAQRSREQGKDKHTSEQLAQFVHSGSNNEKVHFQHVSSLSYLSVAVHARLQSPSAYRAGPQTRSWRPRNVRWGL
ncbi:hypothetical protein HOLleu_42608 [Holothuria leucospilota]|uniref:Uncharacterized protein n=1 Tax=Holothuria leucospilota TaxID=206669 RepID=A0A9Q0YCN7_HOLLE|nr:hypothetical protein HOLleu_42608 [Holothuria leucospilota]